MPRFGQIRQQGRVRIQRYKRPASRKRPPKAKTSVAKNFKFGKSGMGFSLDHFD